MSFGGRFGHLVRSIGEATDQSQPINTKKAYDPKKKEFLQYCDSVFGSETNPRIVTEEKAYGFICYHAHREKTKKRESASDTEVVRFDKKNIMMK